MPSEGILPYPSGLFLRHWSPPLWSANQNDLLRYEHAADAEIYLESLLSHDDGRAVVVDALSAHLHGERRGERERVASMLVRTGSPVTFQIANEILASIARWPVAPLALIALTNSAAQIAAVVDSVTDPELVEAAMLFR
jgi:hypothetical protein